MILPGWNCAECLTFNGEEKEPLHVCRACGKPRKTFGLPLETMMRHLRTLEENLCATQQRCTRQEEELRANHREMNMLIEGLHDGQAKLAEAMRELERLSTQELPPGRSSC